MSSPTKPTRIEVSFDDDSIKRMLELLRLSVLPDKPPIPTSDEWKHGTSLQSLIKMREMFENEWSWGDLAAKLNQFDNYTVSLGEGIDAFDLHFMHAMSSNAGAVPLLLVHGWPGSVYEFTKVIEQLANPTDGKQAFHVVIPSLPGFFLSTHPQREGWSIVDTARVFNRLMVDILGYSRYYVHGGDWGSYIARILGANHHEAAAAVHITLLSAYKGFDPDKTPLSELERFGMQKAQEYVACENGYAIIQKTKPFTIGYSIGASPLSVLAYIGEKYHAWSDPELLDPWDIINTSALYFLTGTSASAALIYHESFNTAGELEVNRAKWKVKSKFGYTHYKYDLTVAPAALLDQFADKVIYSAEYENGGHFSALDVPDLFVEDLRKCFDPKNASL